MWRLMLGEALWGLSNRHLKFSLLRRALYICSFPVSLSIVITSLLSEDRVPPSSTEESINEMCVLICGTGIRVLMVMEMLGNCKTDSEVKVMEKTFFSSFALFCNIASARYSSWSKTCPQAIVITSACPLRVLLGTFVH